MKQSRAVPDLSFAFNSDLADPSAHRKTSLHSPEDTLYPWPCFFSLLVTTYEVWTLIMCVAVLADSEEPANYLFAFAKRQLYQLYAD